MLMPWDKPDHIDYLKTLKILRGYFRSDNLLVGGSYVYSKELDIEWSKKDIDVFILMPRMETWALVNILNQVFDMVTTFDNNYENLAHFMRNKDQYYKIDGQWKRILAYKNDMMYDLIFVDDTKENLILNNTGSDISRLYYNISYNKDNLVLNQHSIKYKNKLIDNKLCSLDSDQCTEAYASKVKSICKYLNIEVKEWKK